MNFMTTNYKPGNTLVPSDRTDNLMSIREIQINRIINNNTRNTKYKCAIKYLNGNIETDAYFFKEMVHDNFSLKLKDLLQAL